MLWQPLGKYANSCPKNMIYSYNIISNSRTCRCISTSDLSCHSYFPPVDGCICAEGTYLDDSEECVPPKACPCYDKGSVVPPGEVINKEGVMWYEKHSICINKNVLMVCYNVKYVQQCFFSLSAPVSKANSTALENMLYSHVSNRIWNSVSSTILKVSAK